MYFNVWLKTRSRQWVLAGDFDAMFKRAVREGAERRRISLLECEAMLDHMRLRIGARDGGPVARMMHVLSGASARLVVRAASDIRVEAGVSNFWRKGQGPEADAAISAVRRRMRRSEGTGEEG